MAFFRGLDTEAYDRTYTDIELVQRVSTYFLPHQKKVWVIVGLLSFFALVGAAQPIVISRAVESLEGQPSTQFIIMIVTIMIIFGVSLWGANWLRRRLLGRVMGDVVTALRQDAFNASINHDMSFFDKFESGRIISRITSDTQEFATVVQLITNIVSQLLLVFILITVLTIISWQLTLIIVAMLPVVIAATVIFRKVARYVTRRGFQVLAKVNAAIKEAVTGISIAKNFRQEHAIYQSFSEVNQQSYIVNLQRGLVMASVFPLLSLIVAGGTAALLYWGGQAAANEVITIGAWYLFMVSIERFWFSMMNMAAFWSQIQGGLSAAERIFALIDTQSNIHQIDNRFVAELKGEIEFKDIYFRYTDQEQILEEFSLHIQHGESIALVGHTGAGKSSIIKLITRFYEFQSGQICIDGNDIRTFDLTNYRRKLGIVSQTPFLFSGTVADNIRYARPELTTENIESVANQIGHGEWLATLPDGLQTDVGERGVKLSMGQRQLVALTRVLVQQPAIFILDEATASVDPFTESQIQEAMDLILKCSTSIMIAHRLSTIRAVDRILVVENGKIIEEGNHDKLMTNRGHYAELYNAYFRHQSLDYIEEVGRRRIKKVENL